MATDRIGGHHVAHARQCASPHCRRHGDRPRVDARIDHFLPFEQQGGIASLTNARRVRSSIQLLCEQLAVNAAEAAVGHQHDDISGPMLAHDRVDDGVDVRDMTSLLATTAKIVDQLHGIEPLGFRQATIGTRPRGSPDRPWPNARAKSSWNTRRHEEAERGSNTAHTRLPG